jgi:hypothetical protein
MFLHIERLRLSLGHTLALIGVINPLWVEMGMEMEIEMDSKSQVEATSPKPFMVIDDKGGEEDD